MFSDGISCTCVCRRQEPVVGFFASMNSFPMLQEGSDAFVPVTRQSCTFRTGKFHGCFSVDLLALLHGGGSEHIGACALHDAPKGDNGKYQRDECNVGHMHGTFVHVFRAMFAFIPAFPIFPGGILARIMRPLPLL